jgi:hypothetical protein
MCPTTGVLTLRKVTVRPNLVGHFGSGNNDLPFVQHDARVDLNPNGARIRYAQELALLAESPPSSPPPYIVAWRRAGVGHGKVLIPNPDYKGKGHTESI